MGMNNRIGACLNVVMYLSGFSGWANATQSTDAGKQVKLRILTGEIENAVAPLMPDYDSLMRTGDLKGAEALVRPALAELRAQPELDSRELVLNLTRLGDVLVRTRRIEEAGRLFKEARIISEQAFGLKSVEVASAWHHQANFFQMTGQIRKAVHLHRKALVIQMEGLGPEHPDTLTGQAHLAIVLQHRGDVDEAARLFAHVLQTRLDILGNQHPDVSVSYHMVAYNFQLQGKHEKAAPYYRKAYEVSRILYGEEHRNSISGLYNIALNLAARKETEPAIKLLVKIVALKEKVEGPDSLKTAQGYFMAGFFMKQNNAGLEATKYFEKAAVIAKKVLGENHPQTMMYVSALSQAGTSTKFVSRVEQRPQMHETVQDNPKLVAAYKLKLRADNLVGQEIYNEAEEPYLQALELLKQELGEDHVETAGAYNDLANLYVVTRSYEDALWYGEKALNIRRRVLGDRDDRVISSFNFVGLLLNDTYRFERAEVVLTEAVGIARDLFGSDTQDVLVLRSRLAFALMQLGKMDHAHEMILDVFAIASQLHPSDSAHLKFYIRALADIQRADGDYSGAEKSYRSAHRIRVKYEGDYDPEVVVLLSRTGEMLFYQDKFKEAEPIYRKVLATHIGTHGPDNSYAAQYRFNLGALLLHLDRRKEAFVEMHTGLSQLKQYYWPDDHRLMHYQRRFDQQFYWHGFMHGKTFIDRAMTALHVTPWIVGRDLMEVNWKAASGAPECTTPECEFLGSLF